MDTIIEYRIFPAMARAHVCDPIVQMKGMVTMTDYHFRVNAERLGIDPLTITIMMHWGDGECRFEIEAPTTEEPLVIALDEAVRLIGLRVERFSKLRR